MPLLVSALPRCVAIIFQEEPTQFLYLRGGHPKREDYLTFSELSIDKELESSMHTRFYLDPSKEHGDEEFVHVRCAYNNKYLVAKEVKEAFRQEVKEHGHPNVKFLVDMADEPEEDLSKPSCTLFIISGFKSGSKYKVSFDRPGTEGIVGFLSSPDTNKEAKKVYSQMFLIDVTEQIILPPYVAFKGDNDLFPTKKTKKDLYLTTPGSNKCLSFSPSDITETSARFTTHNYADGTVRIKSVAMDNFLWAKDKIWIGADVTTNKDSSSFKAFKYGDLFALQAMSDGKFLSVRAKGKEDNYLVSTDSADITPRAKFRLEEPVINRDIYNVQYHRKDHARIYDTTEMKVAAASAINRTSEKNTVKSSLSITTKESSKWEATATHKASGSVSTSAGFSVPLLGGVDIEAQFGYEFSHATNWGTSVETEKRQDIEYEVTVPANKKVTLTVTAKQAKYDVPFSYTQRDMLPNGEKKIYNYDDGLYSGVNCFNLHYETKEEDIPTKEEIQSNKRRRL